MHLRHPRPFCLLAAFTFVFTSACGRAEDPAINTTGTTSPRATPTATGAPDAGESAPSISIEAPEDGARVPAGGVEVKVSASNFKIVAKLGQPAAEGEGHVHFYKDVQTVPTDAGKPAVTEQGTYHASATDTYTWPDVAAGEHSFSAQLVNNDHKPLSPPVFRTVKVTVT